MTIHKWTGETAIWIFRVLGSVVLVFSISEIIEGLFFSNNTFFSRKFWEGTAFWVSATGFLCFGLYVLILWFYSPSRPWPDRLLFISLILTLMLFNPLAKG